LERGLSQDQLAERAGLERRKIQRTEKLERDPTYGDLLLIAHVFDMPFADLVEPVSGPPYGD
jgi:transcriptional regulator with XRE-family HTH domain